jgi:hypothetical protein
MGTIYYSSLDAGVIEIPVSLRHHRDRDAFLLHLAHSPNIEAWEFAKRLFAQTDLPLEEAGHAYGLIALALERGLTDLATEIGDLIDSSQY